MLRWLASILAAVVSPVLAMTAQAAPTARFDNITYVADESPAALAGTFRNPILPGFQPDPSIVRVGEDFYLVNSTFGWFPGIPVYHSRDLVHWNLVGHAIDRPGMLDFTGLGITRAVFAPAITWHAGTFYILNTCVDCRGNFLVTSDRAEGPWSNPVWLDFDGIDPSLFIDDDGTAWVVNNGEPEGPARYEGHRAIWIQQFDLVTLKLFGPRKVLVDGGVHPQDKPIWAEGPHLYKVGGWYYLMAAEGGTAERHSETIYRSRRPDGPYEAGSANPILTQRDLPADRLDRVEATGHADLVQLDDGSWWGVFLATRPFSGQSTLLGRETWLLPVAWTDGWPLFLETGKPIPFTVQRPNLPPSAGTDWSRWIDSFDGEALSPEWLQMRSPTGEEWWTLDRERGELDLVARPDAAGGLGEPSYFGRRLRHPAATVTTRLSFAPERDGDFAGLLALIDENHFLAFGIERAGGARTLTLRKRNGAEQPDTGVVIASRSLPEEGEIELAMKFDRASTQVFWRLAGSLAWQPLDRDLDAETRSIDIEYMSSIHAGLFTGVLVGPYAFSPGS